MNIGLFVPCYIDQMYPDVAVATTELLESLGASVGFPDGQTCCGQPMANTGCSDAAKPVAKMFLDLFDPYDYIVCPSGSCTSMVRHHYDDLVGDDPRLNSIKSRTFELCEFLTDVMPLGNLDTKFPYRVGVHQSCHGLRELRLGNCSERMMDFGDKVLSLLGKVSDIEIVDLERKDECCGFGGTFAVNERAISVRMGEDRINDHVQSGAQVMVASDMSCLMHMWGLMSRNEIPLGVMHVAQVLVGREPKIVGQPATATRIQN